MCDINKKLEITSKRHVPMVLLVHTKPDLGRNRTYQTYCNEQTEQYENLNKGRIYRLEKQ